MGYNFISLNSLPSFYEIYNLSQKFTLCSSVILFQSSSMPGLFPSAWYIRMMIILPQEEARLENMRTIFARVRQLMKCIYIFSLFVFEKSKDGDLMFLYPNRSDFQMSIINILLKLNWQCFLYFLAILFIMFNFC